MNSKEILLKELDNVNPSKCDIKISRTPDYSLLFSTTSQALKCVTYISIVSGGFTTTISSNDHCSFSVYSSDNVVERKSYAVEYVGLFKEAYSIVKPLLLIEV